MSPQTASDRSVVLDRLLNRIVVKPHGFGACRVAAAGSLSVSAYDTATLNYVVAGRGLLRVAARDVGQLGRRSIVLLPSAMPHVWAADGEAGTAAHGRHCPIDGDLAALVHRADNFAELVVVTVRVSAALGSGLGLFDRLREPAVDQFAEVERARSAFEGLISEWAAPGIGSTALIQAYLQQLLVLFFRRRLLDAAPGVHDGLGDENLSRALLAIVEHLERPHTIAGLARGAGMSETSFAGRFRTAFGQSPLNYIHLLRMQTAAHLLATTDLQIKVIARDVGFSSRSYFSRAFRARFGVDPTAFRVARSLPGDSQ